MNTSNKKILLTGASGFIGSHVLAELLRRGYEVHAVVHHGEVNQRPGVTVHRLDLLDPAAVEAFIAQEKFTHLLHFAWYVGEKLHVHEKNLDWLAASLCLLKSFGQHGGQHFLGAGSCAEYEYRYGLLHEGDTPTAPGLLYGNAKNALCRLAEVYCRMKEMRFQWTRIFNLYGPGEKPQRLMPSVIRSCLRGEDVRVSECTNFLDYLHVADTARGIADVFESEINEVVNISSGQPVQLRCIVEMIAKLTGFAGNILWGAVPSAFEDELVVGDNRRLRSLGWKPRYDIISGLQDTINYWKQHV